MFASGLYAGLVTHARLKPRRHVLRYRIFMLLLDLDELTTLDRRLKLFSLDRWNLLSFRPRSHGDGSATPLKQQVEAKLADAGLETGGPVRMLAMPRILGHGFNPLTVYFCHRSDGTLSAILYEVNNTFGERHSYLIPATDERAVRQACDKGFYVSPFMDMALHYDFKVRPPAAETQVFVDTSDDEGLVLTASFAGARAELTDRALFDAWRRHPWMTVGVLTAIHWEALKIWLKGEKIRRRPPKPEWAVTVVTPAKLAA